MDNYKIDTIIPFNMVIDLEMGLMRLIKFEYRNEYFLYESIENEDFIKTLLMERKNKNPLSVITIDKTPQEEIDDLYQQFMKERYDKILSLSPNTELFRLLLMSNKDESVRFTIVFNDEEQEKLFDLRKGYSFRRHVGNVFDEELIKNNSNIFIKDIADLSKQTQEIRGKNIYLADYGFNKKTVEEEYIPNFKDGDYERFSKNTFQFITMYKIDETRIGKY